MNFKRFHESKNLFDATSVAKGRINSSTGAIEYAGDTPTLTYSDTNNEFTITTRYAWRGFVTDYLDLQEKPVFSYISDDGTFYVFFYAYDANKNFLGAVSSSVPTGTKYIRGSIQCGTAVTNAKIKNIMLNTGSQPLPYEPYSSEVWHNVPYYIMGTSTDTLTTLPAVLYPNATTATVGLKGNTSQASGVSPTNPIQPQECGERTGQIIEYPYFDESGVITGVQWTISENGHIKGIGTTSGGTNFYLNRNIFLKAGTYTLKIYGKHEGMVLRIYDSRNATIVTTIPQSNTDSFVTFTLNSDTSNECRIYFNVGSAGIAVDIDCDIMLNLGSEPLPYEPYGYKIPISSANTTTPVYLGEVETTRKIKKLVLTGEETLTSGSVIGQIRTPLTGAIDSLGLCTHYILKTSYGGAFPYIRIRSNTLWFEISPDGYETKEEALTDFTSYLAAQYAAGTPVCVWYVLATPQTAVVNEPLMKIGDYADTVSGIAIPTIAGANTISVDTTLQPSEVTVNYHGWHPVQSVHEADNGAWTE